MCHVTYSIPCFLISDPVSHTCIALSKDSEPVETNNPHGSKINLSVQLKLQLLNSLLPWDMSEEWQNALCVKAKGLILLQVLMWCEKLLSQLGILSFSKSGG